MNPYTVLNVPHHATEEEIKTAYQNLVKRYHSDQDSIESAVIMQHVNEAYEILSDPLRKERYDRKVALEYEQSLEEDPVERYNREYKRKRWEEEKKQEERTEAEKKQVYTIIRMVCLPILLFALLLTADYFLPQHHYEEVADWGWSEKRGDRRSSYYYVSRMRTPHFVLTVPDEVRLDYDYFDKPGIIKIDASPIFRVPGAVSVNGVTGVYEFETEETIYSGFPMHYLLLLSSLFTVFRKEASVINFSLSFLPFLFLGFILLSLIF